MTLNLFISAILLFHEIYEREKQWKQNKTKQNKKSVVTKNIPIKKQNKTKQNDITSKSSFVTFCYAIKPYFYFPSL